MIVSKFTVVIRIIFILTVCDSAANFKDLQRQFERNPQLRRMLIETFAKSMGRTLMAEKIDLRGSMLQSVTSGMNSKPFGIELTPLETIDLLLLSFIEAPRPDRIIINRHFQSNGDLGLIMTTLKALKAMLTKKERIDEDDSLIVDTTEGKLRGVRVEEEGIKYIGYFNIQYATLPKRFKAPKPPKSWKGVRNAKRDGKFCPQRVMYVQQIGGYEDCLQLDIHIPIAKKRGRSVFVWVHGGGFHFGIGSSVTTNPKKLLKQDVIFISFHYRLGALGFLSTGTKDAPGNAGMKDMVAALKWIKANIENFGGDPNSITLYGVSSGAIAIEYLILSPMAKGLFHRAILSGGSVFNEWAYATEPLKYAFRLGRELGSNATDVKDLVRFLRRVNPLQLVEAQEKIGIGDNPSGDFIPFVPCAEVKIPGVEPFITDIPENIMMSGQYNHLPVIIMFNNQEGLTIFSKLRSNPKYLFSIEENMEFYIPRDILAGLTTPQQKQEILKKIRQFYFRGEKIGNKTVQETVNLFGDTKFLLGIYKSVKLRTETSKAPTFYAKFAYDGDLSAFKYFNDISVKGVAHADDLGYVLTLPFEKVYSSNNSTSRLVSRRMVTMFTNFAKYGNPTPMRSELLPVTWYPIQSGNTYDYLEITNTLQLKQNPFQQRYQFWDQLYQYKEQSIYQNSRSFHRSLSDSPGYYRRNG